MRHVSIIHLLAPIIPSLIRLDKVQKQRKSGDCTSSLCNHDRKFRRPDIQYVFGLNGLRTDDVPGWKRAADGSSGESTLGGSTEIVTIHYTYASGYYMLDSCCRRRLRMYSRRWQD
jgi:hypothetical protein